MQKRTWVRFAVIGLTVLLLVPPVNVPPADGGSVWSETGPSFANGTKVNITSIPEGLRLPWNQTYIGNWTPMFQGPSDRENHAMAFDSDNGVILLFGGWNLSTSEMCSDTWIFNLSTDKWTEQHPKVSPDGRECHKMAYDSVNGVVVLFGGTGLAGSLSDTWTYNVTTNIWKKMYPAQTPPPSGYNSMVYDKKNQKMIYCSQQETWIYDTGDDSWTNMNPVTAPSIRDRAAMAYDDNRGKVVFFGGIYDNRLFNDTWTYDLSTNSWTNTSPVNSPPARSAHCIVYDSLNDCIILHGGTNLDDTWIYTISTNTWIEKKPSGDIECHWFYSMVFETTKNQTFLFGGGLGPEETWTYNLGSNTWTRKPTAPIRRFYCQAFAYDNDVDVAVLFGGYGFYAHGCYNDTWTYSYKTNCWQEMRPTSAPSPRAYSAMVYDSANGQIVLFGGCNPNLGWTGYDDTWTYNVTTNVWTNMKPTPSPQARSTHSMVYDQREGVVVLFGGSTLYGKMNDTWIYNLSTNTWVEKHPDPFPISRGEFGMAYDRENGVVVLFGGVGASSDLNDTWTYNVSTDTWTNMNASNAPCPRVTTMAYDGINEETVLVAGRACAGGGPCPGNDVWTYNLNQNKWTQQKSLPSASFARNGIASDCDNGVIIIFGGEGSTSKTFVYSLKRFLPAGNYTSAPFGSGGQIQMGTLQWNGTLPSNTSICLQLRTSVSQNALNSTPFIGPDGTNRSYYSSTGQAIYSGHNGDRWIQYRAYLCTTNPSETPVLKNVTIKYNLLPDKAVLDSPIESGWINNSRPTFSWNFSDGDSLVGGFEWEMDNSSLFDSVDYKSGQLASTDEIYQPDAPIPDGSWYWRVRTQDSDGDWGPFSAGRLLHIDARPPNSFQPTASPSDWTNGTIQISYETTDAFAGMDHFDVEIDGVSQGIQESPFTLPFLSDGEHNITIKAYDKLWNAVTGQINVFLDRTPPLEFAPSAEPPRWTNGSVRLLYETTDATSGVDRYEVKVDNGAFTCQTSPFVLPNLPDGQHNVTVRAFDKAGNFMDGSVMVYRDCSKPFNFSISPEFSGWTNKNPNITFQALDNTSEIDHFEVKIPAGNFTVQTSPFKLPELPDGRHTILIRAYDKAMNYVEMSLEVLVDKTAPADFTPTADPAGWTNKNPRINFTTTDNTSGVGRYEIRIDTGTMSASTSPFSVPNQTDGEHQILVRAYDAAGNSVDGTVRVYVDKTAPTQLFLKINDAEKSTGKRRVTLTLIASDPTSGIESMAFSNDGTFFSDWEPFNESKVWELSKETGVKSVYFKVKDKAGNEASAVSSSIKYTIPAAGGQDYSLLLYLMIALVIVAVVVFGARNVFRKRSAGAVEVASSEKKAEEASPEPPLEKEQPPEALPEIPPEAEKTVAEAEPEVVKAPLKVEPVSPVPETESRKAPVLPALASLKAAAPPVIAPPKPVSAPKMVSAPPKPALMTAPEGFAVEDIFLMYRDGRLVQHATRRLKADMDVDVVTSMLTAVQEFIKESFGKAAGEELGSMEFGESKIMLQKGKYVVLAAVISGPEAPGFREELKTAIQNIESEFGAVLPEWNGMTATLAGAKKFLTVLGTYQPVAAAPAKDRDGVILKSELEFYQGFVRLKVAVKNSMPTMIAKATFKLIYNDGVFRLDHVEPELERNKDEVTLGIVEPGEKTTVAFYLDPQICTESHVEGVLTYKDAQGRLNTMMMPRKLASVVCPILFTDENINTAMLKRMAVDDLDKKDTKVFSIPPQIPPQRAFELAKSAVQHHDLRQVREFMEKEPFVGEAWYFGKAKERQERLVVRARVIAEKGFLEFFVASDSVLMLTGMLAELKSDLNKELEGKRVEGRMVQVTDTRSVDAMDGVMSLLDKYLKSEGGPEGREGR